MSHLEAKVTTEFSRGRGIFLHDPVLKKSMMDGALESNSSPYKLVMRIIFLYELYEAYINVSFMIKTIKLQIPHGV